MTRAPFRRAGIASLLLLVAALFFTFVQTASAAQSGPAYRAGNPTCRDFDASWSEIVRVDPVANGTFGPVTVSITVADDDARVFDWSSTAPIVAVFAKGSSAGHLYTYSPPASAGSGLHAPTNKKGSMAGLSHISFCVAPTPTTTVPGTTTTVPGTTTTVPGTTTTVPGTTTTTVPGTTTTVPGTTTTTVPGTTTTTVAVASADLEVLPETGLSVSEMAAMGLMLLAIGTALTRVGQNREG